jgi:hypothetical protein
LSQTGDPLRQLLRHLGLDFFDFLQEVFGKTILYGLR